MEFYESKLLSLMLVRLFFPLVSISRAYLPWQINNRRNKRAKRTYADRHTVERYLLVTFLGFAGAQTCDARYDTGPVPTLCSTIS